MSYTTTSRRPSFLHRGRGTAWSAGTRRGTAGATKDDTGALEGLGHGGINSVASSMILTGGTGVGSILSQAMGPTVVPGVAGTIRDGTRWDGNSGSCR